MKWSRPSPTNVSQRTAAPGTGADRKGAWSLKDSLPRHPLCVLGSSTEPHHVPLICHMCDSPLPSHLFLPQVSQFKFTQLSELTILLAFVSQYEN